MSKSNGSQDSEEPDSVMAFLNAMDEIDKVITELEIWLIVKFNFANSLKTTFRWTN